MLKYPGLKMPAMSLMIGNVNLDTCGGVMSSSTENHKLLMEEKCQY